MKKASDLPLVEVTWIDAQFETDAEASLKDGTAHFGSLVQCQSIGYLIRKNKREVVLASARADDDSIRFAFSIPTAWVRSITVLAPEPIVEVQPNE